MITSGRIGAVVLSAIRMLAICLAIFTGWILVSAAVMALSEPVDGSLVVLGKDMAPSELEDGTSILWWDGRFAGLTGEKPGWVAGLYRSGALLVLPRRRQTCLALR